MADFLNGLKTAHDYLNTGIDLPTNITGDLATGTVTAQTASFTAKELVCALLAGNGIKLPNIQMCLSVNLSRLIPQIPAALGALSGALLDAQDALNSFIEHTGFDSLLGRLNGAINEIASIANMINFCGTPIIPRPIPNVLKDMVGSFTGKGLDILNQLGQIADQDIGGCVSLNRSITGINFDIFTGGVIKDIGILIDDIDSGSVANLQERLDSIESGLINFTQELEALIEFESNPVTVEDNGGSIFSPSQRINTGVGVMLPYDMSVATATSTAMGLQSLYDQIKAYPVDESGKNLFDYILEPELIAKLENNVEFSPTITERQPVYDYCGRIIGYTTNVVNGNADKSTGGPVQPNLQPGAIGLEPENREEIVAQLQAQIEALTARLDALEGN